VLRVTAPPHRLDIQEGPADLIEDLARLYGYDRLPATLLADRLPPQTGNPALEFEERVRDLLRRLENVIATLTKRECKRQPSRVRESPERSREPLRGALAETRSTERFRARQITLC